MYMHAHVAVHCRHDRDFARGEVIFLMFIVFDKGVLTYYTSNDMMFLAVFRRTKKVVDEILNLC